MTTVETFTLAIHHQQAGDLAASESLFRQVIDQAPNHFGAAERLSLLLMQNGRLEEAVAFAEQAVRLNPGSAAAHHNLGLALRCRGLPGQALAHCRHAVALEPANADCHDNLATVLAALGERSEATAQYLESLRLNPRQPRVQNNLGTLHAQAGRLADADACYRSALHLRPDYPEALANLTNSLAEQGRTVEAAACAGRWLALRPDDENAQFLHAALTGVGRPSTMPPALVTALFDRYSPSFEDHLVNALEYAGPQLLRAAVPDCPGPCAILDLGCGTGLCGVAFRDLADTLTGVDLSAPMLARAKARGIYDRLIQGDIVEALQASSEAYDLILCADVFMYVGDLSAVFPAARGALRPRGRFVFVVEADDGEDYILRSTRRYAHPPKYVRALAASCGLSERGWNRGFLRKKGQEPIDGDVYVLERAPDSRPD
jgi:predicted TPR repeat methyltransferase